MATVTTRLRSNGQKVYQAKIRLRGFPPQSAVFERLTDARKWVQETESAIRQGRYFSTAEAKRHTFAELVERYHRDVMPEKKNNSRFASNQEMQLNWWKEQIGHLLLSDITPALIVEKLDKLASEPIGKENKTRSPSTVVRYLAALSHALSTAVNEWGWIDDNPMRKVRRPREPRGRVRFLSDTERAAVLEACQQSRSLKLYPMVVLALATGMRLGEIQRLRWADIDFPRGRIILHETKNGERRAVPLVGHALTTMQDYGKVRGLDNSLVFPSDSPRKKNTPFDPQQYWRTALKQAAIEDFRFHDLRHSAASYLAMNGASLAEIAEVLGHKTLQMVKLYAHLSEAHTSGVVAKMNERIFGDGRKNL